MQQKLLALLNERYGIDEADLLSAELEIVPAGKARDAGLDGSLIAAYGHDDRSCVYAGLQANITYRYARTYRWTALA